MITLAVLLLVTEPTFFNDVPKADAVVADINRSVRSILTSDKSTKAKEQSLLKLQERLNKEYAGKGVIWNSRLTKAVAATDKRVEATVPSWITGAIGKQLTLNNSNDVAKYYVVSASFDGNWVKSLKRGDALLFTATVKEVVVSVQGVSISITGAVVKKP